MWWIVAIGVAAGFLFVFSLCQAAGRGGDLVIVRLPCFPTDLPVAVIPIDGDDEWVTYLCPLCNEEHTSEVVKR